MEDTLKSSRKRLPALLATVLAVASLSTTPASAARDSPDGLQGARALLRYTEQGIPHILAKDFGGLGYGYGYAVAKDNICELANGYLTLAARRSAEFGPGGTGNAALSDASTNLTSDLHFQQINDSGVVERLVAQPAPMGPRREVRDIISGYVQGYNRYLAEKGPDGITDPACHGAAWLRPITDLDVYRNVYAVTTIAGVGGAADEIVDAKPSPGAAPVAATPGTVARIADGMKSRNGDGELGSNGIAVGADGTASGHGSVLLGNPHYPWQGGRRFWQSQLTIPGEFDVSGGSLLGLPLISIGHTANAAWTHTVSTSVPFGLFEVPLVPGDQRSYLVDGKAEKMTSQTVSVEVKQPGGELKQERRTLYSTRYGPIVGSFAGIPLPWTTTSAHSLRDANATNMRVLNAWFDLNRAQSTGDLVDALKSTQGLPWVNTIGTDRAGNALYSDIQVVPHVTDQQATGCGTPLGRALFPSTGLSILDGSRTSCGWGSDPDSIEPGLFSPAKLPLQQRRDYTLNTNDSSWLANADAPITGYPRVVGDIGTPRSARTREALITAEEGIRDGGFTTSSMKQTLFGDRSRTAELAASDTAKMCAAFPGGKAPSAQGPVDVGPACAALAKWDHHYTLDSRGSLLFERFVLKLGTVPGGPWSVPFDPAKPVTTPNTLNVANPAVRQAFGDAVAELNAAGVPLDGRLRDNQAVTRNGERIPIHGAPGAVGVLNVTTPVWQSPGGNVEIVHGTSFVQVVGFEGQSCPDTSTLLTYSQSTDPTSPYFADQTKKFSRGEWVRGRFCEGDILRSPALRVVRLR
ncbi:penicillin acylase family protein [Amycolatopsis sp. H20-H5]|uniref:penicillin acylase family protein n=1 Tax=Amycolatopsis sp. H20-H5 TaxID=3046309 RepID=UPI002DB77273|nr:penicillin acylase family protein [Amycolatopsis sp. H20-H5]MEC3979082.1 penicillin acylase family protein [Amycolatopsis sp. H20-H5]